MKSIHQKSSSLIIGLPHLCNIFISIPECFYRRILTCSRRTHDRKLMDLYHLLHNLCWCTGITKPPACHRICLGKSIDIYGSFSHSRQTDDRNMLFLVTELCIDLICDHKDILFPDNFRNLLQVLLFHDRTCRIIGKWQDQYLRLVCDRIPQFLCCQAEFIFFLQFNNHWHCICKNRTGFIGYIAGLWDQYLLSRIDHCPECQINRFRTTNRYQDLMHFIIMDSLASLYIIADFLSQLLQACIGGIKGSSLFQGVNALISDMPWCIEVGFSNAKGNSVLHFIYNITKFTDTGGLDIHNFIC